MQPLVKSSSLSVTMYLHRHSNCLNIHHGNSLGSPALAVHLTGILAELYIMGYLPQVLTQVEGDLPCNRSHIPVHS